MAKHAVIVESPAKTRTLERFLGSDYKCLASMGHVRDLPKKELGVSIEDNFRPHYEAIPSAKKVLSGLRKALKGVDTVYLASDPDREGEAIGWHLAQALNLKNVQRIRFNEITEAAVQEALENADDIDMDRVDAQQARRVLDRLVGYLISPVLWKRIKTGSQALSAGRVQSVALRMIVDREREIAAFEAEEYWTIEALLTPADRDAQFTAELQSRDGEKIELHTQGEADAVAGELKQAEYLITDIARQTRRRNPAPPFITSTLQQQASRQLRFSARKTMAVAQQLYEGIDLPEGMTALITYMRTDSTRIADSARQEAAAFIKGKFGPDYVGKPKTGKAKKKGVQDAHEAIRPTDVGRDPESIKGYLTDDQLKLYELIWRRFVASQMAAAVFDVTTVDIAAGRYGLRASGSVPIFAGYRSVYEEAKLDDENDNNGDQLPELNVGEALKLLELSPEQHFTKPPPRFTEASLVRALEENGIGRPSTYSDIIETLRQRKYAYMQKRAFVPTRLGVVVCDYLVEHFPQVMDVQFTARVEADLDTVERGEQDWVQLVREFYGPLSSWIREAETAPPKRLGEKCPECGGELIERYSASGRFAGCENFPKCEYTRDLDSGVPDPEVPDLENEECPECGKPLTVKQGPRGAFIGCTGYPTCRYTRPIDDDGKKPAAIETDIPCEECGQPLKIRTGKRGPFLGCSGFPKCRFTRNLTPEEAERFSVTSVQTQPDAAEVEPPPDAECPECGAAMVVRSGRRGQFLGCSRYPQCRGTLQLDGSPSTRQPRAKPEPTGEDCPECGKPLVVRSGRRGKFVGCSGYPNCRYVRDFSG